MSLGTTLFLLTLAGNAIAFFALLRRSSEPIFRLMRWFFALEFLVNAFEWYVLLTEGSRSHLYAYTYYGGDLLANIFGFLVLARLVEAAFEKSTLKLPGLRTGAIAVFTGTTACSAAIVYLLRGSLTIGRFSLEMEQNFNFLGMLLAVVLFVLINMMQVPGVRFRRVVLSFSVFYSTGAIVYSLLALAPGLIHVVGGYGLPLINTACILLLAYSVWVPEAPRAQDRLVMPSGARLASIGNH